MVTRCCPAVSANEAACRARSCRDHASGAYAAAALVSGALDSERTALQALRYCSVRVLFTVRSLQITVARTGQCTREVRLLLHVVSCGRCR